MERKNPYNLEKYLTIGRVAEILQVDLNALSRIVENGVVQPFHEPGAKSPNLWGQEEVLRSFFALRLIGEYKEKYGKMHPDYEYDQVNSDLLRIIRVRGREILKSEEWGVVVKRAAKQGLFFKERFF